jgi:hypothetical protein
MRPGPYWNHCARVDLMLGVPDATVTFGRSMDNQPRDVPMRAILTAVAAVTFTSAAALPRHHFLDVATAPRASVDRFSAAAGHLQVRTTSNHLPGPNAPVNFDQGPFVTHGFGPHGEQVTYYNFDVQPLTPAPLFVLYRQGETAPVKDQLAIVDALPGDSGYNDFHVTIHVTVPANYRANSVTSAAALRTAGYPTETTTTIENTPIVPEGSTARLRLNGASAALSTGWYNGKTVRYFTFVERPLTGTTVPVSPIFVSFAANPGTPSGGPASGFKTEPGTQQTHNVVATLPAEAGYSPLWQVSVYDNAGFDQVHDLATVQKANVLAANVATVNCPVVAQEASNAMHDGAMHDGAMHDGAMHDNMQH